METKKVRGTCFDCYADQMFTYHGLTKGFSERQVKLKYVSMLTKPATTVECTTCDRSLKYTENNGFWETEILAYQGGK